jgi:hypothetical protein
VPAAGLFGIDADNKLELSGFVTGMAQDYAFVNFTGATRLSFSPAFSIVRGVSFAETFFEIGGNEPGEVVRLDDVDVGVPGDYSQYQVVGDPVGQGPGAPSLFESLALNKGAGFEWSDLQPGDLYLIFALPARLSILVPRPPLPPL